MFPWIKRNYFWLLPVLLGILIYSNTFQVPFQFDDDAFILKNYAIRNLSNLAAVWQYFATRFVVILTFALNYHFHRWDVYGYHIVNLAVHLGAALVAGWLARLILATPAMKDGLLSSRASSLSFWASLIFLAHPIQTQSVTYIWQRCSSMAGFFYLAALCLYFKSRLLQIKGVFHRGQRLTYALSLFFGITAVFTKENSATLPLMVLLCEGMFLKGAKPIKWKSIIPFLAILPVIPVLLFSTKPETFYNVERLHYLPDAGKEYVLTQLRVIVTYLRLLFLPFHQNLDYDYPLTKNFMSFPALASLFLLTVIIFVAIRLYSKHRLLSFAIFWFFLTLSVEAAMPLTDIIFEHRLYLPMAGFSLFIPGCLYTLSRGKSIKSINTLLFLLISAYSLLTYQRNLVWKDDFTLWDDTVHKSPHKARPYNNRGVAYKARGALDEAVADFNKAISLDSRYTKAYNNGGVVNEAKGALDKAIADFNQAIVLNPGFAEAYNNRGVVLTKIGKFSEAIADFNQAIALSPLYTEAYNNRAVAHEKRNASHEAISDYSKAISIDPYYAEARYNRGGVYLDRGALDQAISDFNGAIALNPRYAEAYNNRGVALIRKGDIFQATPDFDKAISLKPRYVEAYNNRGVANETKGALDEAISDYSLAISLKPDYREAYSNRSRAYFTKKEYILSRQDVLTAQRMGSLFPQAFLEALDKAFGSKR